MSLGGGTSFPLLLLIDFINCFFQGLPPHLNILSVSCGGTHTCALLVSGDHVSPQTHVYTWGSNESGQLGHEKEGWNTKTNFDPNLVSDLDGKRVIQVACGHSHTLALTDVGCVYSWGCNKFGQVGQSNVGVAVPRPSQVVFFDGTDERRVTQIAAGAKFSAALTKGEDDVMGLCES